MFFKIFVIIFGGQNSHSVISGSTGPIFTEFSPYGRYFVVDYWLDLLLPIAQGMLPWQLILE